jgi:WD40 repeat protein
LKVLSGLGSLAVLAGCAHASAPPPPSAPKPAAPAAAAPAVAPASVAANHACPAPLATPFTVVPQGGMGPTPEFQFSKDGRVAAAKSSLEIQLWNVMTGNKFAVVAPGTPISQWSLRRDGQMVAIVSDGHLTIVDPTSHAPPIKVVLPANVERADWRADGKALFVARGQETSIVDATGAVTATIAAVAAPGGISPDGRVVFTREGSMWDVASNQARWKSFPAASVAFSEDGSAIALGLSQSINVLDVATGNKRWEATTRGAFGGELALSPDGLSAAAYDNGEPTDRGYENRGMNLWNRGKRMKIWQFADAVNTARPAFSPDGKALGFIVSGERGIELRLADGRTGGKVKQPKNANDVRAESPRWASDGRIFLPGSNGLVVLTPGGDRRVIGKTALEVPSDAVTTTYRDAVWSPDDGALLVLAEQGPRAIATVVDLKTGTARATLEAKHFRSAQWNPTTGLIALDRNDGIALWDGRMKQPARLIDPGDGENTEHELAFSPQGNVLATLAISGKEVKLWDPKTGTKTRALSVAGNGDDGAENGAIEAMAWSADGTRIALKARVVTGVEQSTHIAIFDAQSGALVRTLHAKRQYSYNYGAGYGRGGGLAFTPQGKGLVSIDSGRVDLWSAAEGDDPPTTLIEKTTNGPSRMADSGDLLLMGTPTVDVWDLRTRTLTRELRGDNAGVLGMRVARGTNVIAITRTDRIEVHRLTDRSYLTLRVGSVAANAMPQIVADNGAFTGAAIAATSMRVRDGGDLDVRPLRPNEAGTLNRATLALDFVAGCAL